MRPYFGPYFLFVGCPFFAKLFGCYVCAISGSWQEGDAAPAFPHGPHGSHGPMGPQQNPGGPGPTTKLRGPGPGPTTKLRGAGSHNKTQGSRPVSRVPQQNSGVPARVPGPTTKPRGPGHPIGPYIGPYFPFVGCLIFCLWATPFSLCGLPHSSQAGAM